MTIHVYQIAISIISAIMIYKGIASYIKGETGQTFLKVSVRVIVWGGMALIAIFPEFTNILAKAIGIAGNINAVILTGFLLIFLIIFKLLSAIEKLEQGLSEVTRKEALNEIDKKQ